MALIDVYRLKKGAVKVCNERTKYTDVRMMGLHGVATTLSM